MMYLCLECEKLFEEPQKYEDSHGLDSPPYETWYGCPNCAGGYVETMPCDVCGSYITGKYAVIDDSQFVCEECYSIKDIEDLL
jgi:hypothetical protein